MYTFKETYQTLKRIAYSPIINDKTMTIKLKTTFSHSKRQ